MTSTSTTTTMRMVCLQCGTGGAEATSAGAAWDSVSHDGFAHGAESMTAAEAMAAGVAVVDDGRHG